MACIPLPLLPVIALLTFRSDQQDIACTSFTGELQALIRAGIPGKSAQLSLSDIYSELRQRLRAKGLPVPSQRGTDTAHQFPFILNPAARIGSTAHFIQAQRGGNSSREAVLKSPESAQPGRVRPDSYPDCRAASHLVDSRWGQQGIGLGSHRGSDGSYRPRPRRPAHRRRRAHRRVDPRPVPGRRPRRLTSRKRSQPPPAATPPWPSSPTPRKSPTGYLPDEGPKGHRP